jgi:hypothetical protein
MLTLSQADELVLALERARTLSNLLYSEILGISGSVDLYSQAKRLVQDSEKGERILKDVEFGSEFYVALNFFEASLNASLDEIRENVSDWKDAERVKRMRRNLGSAPDPQDFGTTKEWEEAAQAYDEKIQRLQVQTDAVRQDHQEGR